MKYLFITLFVLGSCFFMASHIPAWYLSGEKPTHPHWKLYGIIAIGFWVLLLILANTML